MYLVLVVVLRLVVLVFLLVLLNTMQIELMEWTRAIFAIFDTAFYHPEWIDLIICAKFVRHWMDINNINYFVIWIFCADLDFLCMQSRLSRVWFQIFWTSPCLDCWFSSEVLKWKKKSSDLSSKLSDIQKYNKGCGTGPCSMLNCTWHPFFSGSKKKSLIASESICLYKT